MAPVEDEQQFGSSVAEGDSGAMEWLPSVHDSSAETQEKVMDKSIEEDGDNCRICRGEGTTEQPLFYPCKCSGSIKFVHQDCLMEWLSHSQKKYCELCKTPFTFTKLYDRTMPETLPLPLFLRQLVVHTARGIFRWTRFFIVGFVWLGWLPWSIRQVWRGLFWLADGSWASPLALEHAAAMAETATSLAKDSSTSTIPLAYTELSNATVRAELVKVIPQIIAPISAFLAFSSNDFLFVKLIRLLFPNLSRWIESYIYGTALSENTTHVARTGRLPSLLSEVTYFKTLTTHPVLNNAVVDVLEGQLICLLVVTAFILIFLIREWVINQQPAANIPDPDRVDEHAAPPQGNGELRPVVRRRRRGLRDALEQRDRGQNPARPALVDGERPIAVARRARVEGVDGLQAVPAQSDAGQAEGTPALDGVVDDHASQSSGDSPTAHSNRSPVEDAHNSSERRPSLLSTYALDQSVDIRRQIEEGITYIDDSDPELAALFNGPEVQPLSETNLRLVDESTSPPVHVDSPAISAIDATENWNEQGGMMAINSTRSTDGSILPTSDAMVTPETNSVQQDVPPSEISGDGLVVTPESTSNEDDVIQPVIDEAGGPVYSFWNRIANWLWQTEGYVEEPTETVRENDEHVVEDVNGEAPFVPVREREPENMVEDENDGNQLADPPAAPANNMFGIDLNNPEAMEEAEDFDGILELIGMQGPITGMIQNVIFSEFLITLTMAASVWLPYIWGKIALLILANPVGVFIKAPLHIASRAADTIVDMMLFVAGLSVYALNFSASLFLRLLAYSFPNRVAEINTTFFRNVSLSLTKGSGARLERAISGAVIGLRPDLPTFSIISHQALRNFELNIANAFNIAARIFNSLISGSPSQVLHVLRGAPTTYYENSTSFKLYAGIIRAKLLAASDFLAKSAQTMTIDLRGNASNEMEPLDLDLIRWSTRDKVLAIMLGYAFLSLVGCVYLKITRFIFGLKSGEKVEGPVADALTQAGGVMKVILIIGIEMIAFPLYCGLLLDIAMMPLFADVTLESRFTFIAQAPMTALFVHWFIGTCYMFHFALFVSMCRKIMRKGVLYFIRDPDDPSFHPVRDVLERPVAGQLSKIAFSAFVYGGLVILCLGGVIWTLTSVNGVLPINWATNEPRLELPIDIIFYNFMLPIIVRKMELSKKIATLWEWWFRGCAGSLRLTHFMFDEVRDNERGTSRRRFPNLLFGKQAETEEFQRDGTFVRAPASDSVRIPKGEKVFLEVNENNERVDGLDDEHEGPHGHGNKNFTQVYIPPNFRARIATFIFLIWLFAATTGVLFTIGPMLLGRSIIKRAAQTSEPPNDLYAFTVGVHLCAAISYTVKYFRVCRDWLVSKTSSLLNDTRHLFPKIASTTIYLLGLLYTSVAFGVVLPIVFGTISEFYFLLPMHTYLSSTFSASPPTSAEADLWTQEQYSTTIYVLQTWTLGLLYLRLVLRCATNFPDSNTRAATAIRAILKDGNMNPDVRLATRAFLLPALIVSALLLVAPVALGWVVNTLLDLDGLQSSEPRMKVYRYAYPGLLAGLLAGYCAILCKRQLGIWRVRIRDEVYLIGERLHNFGEGSKSTTARAKGKQRVVGIERVNVDVR